MSNSTLVQPSLESDEYTLLPPQLEELLSITLHFVCVVIQSSLMLHFMCKTRQIQISKGIRCAVVLVLIVASLSTAFDLVIIIADLVVTLTHVQCRLLYFSRFVRVMLFELLLCSFWMIRLNHTFKHSALEIARRKFVFAFVFLFALISILCAAFFYILHFSSNSVVHELNAASWFEFDTLEVGVCVLAWTPLVLYAVVLPSQCLIVSANVFFAALFYRKLKALHAIVLASSDKNSKQSIARVQRIFELQQKHTLLTWVPVVGSLLLYAAFDAMNALPQLVSLTGVYWLVDFDMLLKCLCMLLFFKFYERRFAQLCCCCVKCIGLTQREYFPYFNPMPMPKTKTRRKEGTVTIYERIQQQNVKRQSQKMRAKAIKDGTFNAQDFPADEDEADSADADEFNEDASRSYHAPDDAQHPKLLFALSSRQTQDITRVPSDAEEEELEIEVEEEDIAIGVSVNVVGGIELQLNGDIENLAAVAEDKEDDYYDDEEEEFEEFEEFEEEEDFIDRAPRNNTHHHTNTTMSVELSPNDRVDPIHFVEICYWIEELADVQLGTVSQKLQELEAALEKDSELTVDVDELVDQNDIDEFFETLCDGMVLCRLLNTIKSDLCKGFKESTHPTKQRANVQIFVDGCQKLGIRKIDIFDINDLYEGRGLAAVLRCLFAVSAKAKALPTYNGPFVGYKFSEKNERRFTQNTINKGKSAIPFMFRPPTMTAACSTESASGVGSTV